MLVWFSDKIEKYISNIEGIGLRAKQPISAGELVVVKGGHIFSREKRDQLARTLGPSEIQIDEHLFIGPIHKNERDASMMFLNYSCEPNVGVVGQISFHTLRSIAEGEELTFDYATGDDDDWELACNCGSPICRKTVTGRDWMKPEIQTRYEGWFSSFLEAKIKRSRES